MTPERGEVRLFLARLDPEPERQAELRALLSPREEQRALSFATELLRGRWVAARGMLRELVGRAQGVPPSQVVFRYAEHGKPGADGLRFNVSHSGDYALYALSPDLEVGVDVELPRSRRTDALARRFFAPGEQERLFALDEPARAQAFFRLWTCKEAFLKATGEGLSRSLRSYEIDPAQGRVLWANDAEAARWSVHPLDPPAPYAAALVAEGTPRVTKFSWP
jgi:4'-phosphopantetheinyl transferase